MTTCLSAKQILSWNTSPLKKTGNTFCQYLSFHCGKIRSWFYSLLLGVHPVGWKRTVNCAAAESTLKIPLPCLPFRSIHRGICRGENKDLRGDTPKRTRVLPEQLSYIWMDYCKLPDSILFSNCTAFLHSSQPHHLVIKFHCVTLIRFSSTKSKDRCE